MSITTDQYNRLLNRLTNLEQKFDDFTVAINKFVTMTEVNQLLTIISTEIEDIRETLTSVESRLDIIEAEPIS